MIARGLVVASLLSLIATAAAAGESPRCPGDCDGDARVSVAELVRGVRCALSTIPLPEETCEPCFPSPVSIEELIGAVVNALDGCRVVAPTPTPEMATAAAVWMNLIPFHQCEGDAPSFAWVLRVVVTQTIPAEFLPEGVNVNDQRVNIAGPVVCAACSCPVGGSPTFLALVDESDAAAMRAAGWRVVP